MWCEIFCEKSERENRNLERFFRVPSFFNYAIADGIFKLLIPNKIAFQGLKQHPLDGFQLCFDFE
jgi:hypothetical protein